MELTVTACFVQVRDADEALIFYRDVLGLDLRNDVADGDSRWITVGSPLQPGVGIVLTNHVNGGPGDGDAMASLLAKGALNGVNFRTDDLDAMFARVVERGAEVVQEPMDQFWGTRDFAVRDPAGNVVRIDQMPSVLP